MLLRVRFDAPGWFANDPRLVVRVDDHAVYDGSFVRGFVGAIDLSPGPHVLTTAIHLASALARRKEYALDLPSPDDYRSAAIGVEARLRYSRFWGNFERRLDLRRIDRDAVPHP